MIELMQALRRLEGLAEGKAKELATKPASDYSIYQRRVGEYNGILEACRELRIILRLKDDNGEQADFQEP